MKTNIKLRVTPEQSEAVQNICFANGVFWYAGNGSKVRYTKAEYLFIDSDRVWYRAIADHNIGTETEGYTEVDADLFIRTNGTCEEFTCEHPGVDNTTGKCITCGKHIDKSDFEPNIQSSALSSEQLELFRAGRNFEIPQYLVNNPTKLLKELNSELMKATKTTSINLKPECQFAEYGFQKPDFNCELLRTVSGPYENDQFVVGVIKKGIFNNCPHMWSVKYGTCYTSSLASNMSEYNLVPIKKPWYETFKFPALVWDEDNDLLVIRTRGDYASSYLEMCKPLTNDEIEGLKQ